MKYLSIISFILCQLLLGCQVIAQAHFGKLSHDHAMDQDIDISEYHQYELKVKKGTVVLLELSNFDTSLDMTVVNPEGFIVEKIIVANTANFLVFEAFSSGKYQFYVNISEGYADKGKYTLTPQFISSDKSGRLGQINTLIQKLEKSDMTTGTAFAILEKDKVVLEHYHGYANIENKIKNNASTVFELASVSKQFTAMAIAKLSEEDKLSVEDDIRTYFPELPNYRTTIKIKHLLNHTSGIIDSEYPLALAGFENDPIGIDRVLNFLQNTPELYFEPGTEFSYSNDGYTLLGELVYRVTKQSFGDWMKQNIFQPLGMNSTVIRDSPELIIPNRAISYDTNHEGTQTDRLSFDFYAPGGCSVQSSVSDLKKWVAYLNNGYHSDEQLFKRINHLETFPDGEYMEYAYGSFMTDFKGVKRFSHLGLSAGFRTSIARFPDEQLSFIFLGNDGEFGNYYLSKKIYEIYLKDKLNVEFEKFNGINTYVSSDEEFKEEKIDDVFLSEYEGLYYSQQLNASYSFEIFQDTLYALSAAYKRIPLWPTSKDTFESDEDFMFKLAFQRDYSGAVTACEIPSDDDDHSISFTKLRGSQQWEKSALWTSEEYLKQKIDTLSKIEASKILPGFVVSVFDESEIFLQQGFGYANIEEEKKYDVYTQQLIASISKTVTGIAIMKAMELGHFELDDAINEYLPFELTNPNFPNSEITIRHLLTHTSSIDDPKNYSRGYVFEKPLDYNNWPEGHYEHLPFYNNNEKMSLAAFLGALAMPNGKWDSRDELYKEYKPGSEFEYSNLGFDLLGYIIELTTKEDFRDFTQKHIFDPLGMTSSTWKLEEVNKDDHVTYYLENYNPCPYYSLNTPPDGGLFTSVIDLTKFLQEAMKGYLGRGTILTQSSYREMFRVQSNLIEIEGGLGWDLSIPCCVGHAGNDFGTSTVMYFEPRTGIGRIIFANISTETDELSDSFYGIMNLLFLE